MTTDRASRPTVLDPDDVARDPDELGLVALIALAAGGVIGSGWLLGAYRASTVAGSWAWVSWLVGGVLMTSIGMVMVELGRHRPENGGLVFWPLRSSGPLVAMAVAAALWIFYALNPATEAAAVVQAIGNHSLYDYDPKSPGPTTLGILVSAGLMVPIVAVSLLGFRAIRTSTVWLTAFKVFVPVTVVALLIASNFDSRSVGSLHVQHGDSVPHAIISALTTGSVIYAYIGFQGPLDFAGKVKGHGRFSEAARLKISVIGTLVGAMVLYAALQVAFLGHGGWELGHYHSPYAKIATSIAFGGGALAFLLKVDAYVSPTGAGILFAMLLSEEVEALSRDGLTDTRLATVGRPLWPRGPVTNWPILAVNLVIGWIELALFGGDWGTMVTASSILTLFVYAMPAVSLTAFAKFHAGQPDRNSPDRFRIRWWWQVLAWFGFVGVAEVLYWAEWPVTWRAAVLLTCATLVLLTLPLLSRRVERFRLYVAGNPWSQRDAVPGLVVLGLFLVALLILSCLGTAFPHHPVIHGRVGSLLTAVVGTAALGLLRHFSVRYQEKANPPN